ncbi:MAG: QueT transporter family protein [Thermodesulfobacteriota bacterium]
MRELVTMWQSTRMLVLTAVSAALYVAVLLPFKGLVLIPGLTEVRPGIALPVVLSFLFGPAAAWGAGFGNVIADALGGMLTPGSLFGFLGNLFYGYLPHAMWRAWLGPGNPVKSGTKGWLVLALILVADNLMIASVIGWGADLIKLAPFGALGLIIAINNFIASAVLSPILLALLYPRVSGLGLLYHQVMAGPVEGEAAAPPARTLARLGALLCLAGAVIAFVAGLWISAGMLGVSFGAAGFASAAKGSAALAAGMAPGLIVLLVGLILL